MFDSFTKKLGYSERRYRLSTSIEISYSGTLHHIYILGQTGTGKTSLLRSLAIDETFHQRGFCVIDPHGDFSHDYRRTSGSKTLKWDISDPNCPYGYNPLSYIQPEYRPLVASGLIDTLKKQWSDAWGARMEHLLRFAILALLDVPNSTLEDIMPMFLDKEFRKSVIPKIQDPKVKDFWTKEYPSMNYKSAADGVAPIANKFGGFLSHPVVRKALCHPEQPLRFRKIMDEGQILVVNLSKGRLGADISNIVGGLIVSSIAHAAYSRQDIPEHKRRPFFLYVDEFHSFTTSAFAEMLSEMRKYKIGLVLAHQYLSQLEKPVLEAILGNVGTIIAFRLGALDAPFMAKQFPPFTARDFMGLANYEFYIKLMIDGEQSKAFSGKTIAPDQQTDDLPKAA